MSTGLRILAWILDGLESLEDALPFTGTVVFFFLAIVIMAL